MARAILKTSHQKPSWKDLVPATVKKRFRAFMLYDGQGRWQPARHLDVICETMQEIATGPGGKRVIIQVPPRYGKSQVCSKRFPAWYLGNWPDREVMLTSYSADLSLDFSEKSRTALRRHQKIFGVNLSREVAAKNHWMVDGYEGGLVAAGVGGPITGRGANVLIIDDPFKNFAEAMSKTYRETVWNWYLSTARTRLAPGGSIVLIMTRWHHDDLAGRLEKGMEGIPWQIIRFPALAEENDPLGRKPGCALWPERFPLEELEKLRLANELIFAAMYQQRPSLIEGNLFKRHHFRYYERTGNNLKLFKPDGDSLVDLNQCAIIQTCDPAGSTATSADYFVLSTWAITPFRDLILLEVVRVKLEGPDQPGLLRSAFEKWRPVIQGIETKNMGLTLFQDLKRQGLPVKELKPDTDKYTRAIPMAARYEAGTVYHPRNQSPWLYDFEEELLAFPMGEHDDQVDTAAYAALLLPEVTVPDENLYQLVQPRRYGSLGIGAY